MSEAVKMKASAPTNEVLRIDVHDSIPQLANSKTISINTYMGKMTYIPEHQVVKFEKAGVIQGFMPITNAKFIWMK